MRVPALATVLLAALAAGCGGDGGEGEGSAGGPCRDAGAPAPKQIELPPPPDRPPPGELSAVVATSCGEFEIALDSRRAPRTVASFAYLAEEGALDGTAIHRIAQDPALIQGGDPTGTGTGDAGYEVTEPPPPGTRYVRGTVAMAKGGSDPPGRSGSQFFVVTGADARLPAQYALVGRVASGFDVVRTISQFGDPSGASETPLEPVGVDSVRIEGG